MKSFQKRFVEGAPVWLSSALGVGSRRNLTVCDFKHHVGLCADSTKPAGMLSLSLRLSLTPTPSPSQNK